MRFLRLPLVVMLLTGAASALAPAARLFAQPSVPRSAVAGTINDMTGTAVAGASVWLMGTKRVAKTDSSGSFRLDDLSPGQVAFEIRHVGYPAIKQAATLRGGEETKLAIVLPDSDENALDMLGPDAAGFLTRRAHSTAGYYFDHRQIDAMRAFDITQVLRAVPSVEVRTDKYGQHSVQMRSAKSNGDRCRVRVFLDWAPYTGPVSDFAPTSIGALEVYPLGSGMPPQFDPGRGQCGVIVLWSRMPNPVTAVADSSRPPLLRRAAY